MNTQIKLDIVEINNSFIQVSGSSTSFVNIRNISKVDTQELLDKVRSVSKMARQQGIKVLRKNKTLASIRENMVSYEKAVEEYQSLFNKVKTLTEEKVEKGIFYGFSDDKELSEISSLCHKMQTMNYRSQPISVIHSILHSVYRMEEHIKHNKNSTIVSLGF
tara:strand:- start:2250 stop:2735 length:486 start_codon:yes stop_codon:yes gene_type:complete